MNGEFVIAYFTMEIGLESDIPTYAGGLGILAGDTVRAAADQSIPLVAVSLVHRHGYFRQRLDATGWQREAPQVWSPEQHLQALKPRAEIEIEGRNVLVRAWRYEVAGVTGHRIPVLLLDTDLEENAAADRRITDQLYGGDARYRLCQEAVLGIGGVRMLRALGYRDVRRYHMNEGHAALLVLELLEEHRERLGHPGARPEHVDSVREQCVFTTHTPVPAGHDQFPLELALRVLGDKGPLRDLHPQLCCDGVLNMTYLALDNSHYINGVAKKHREVTQHMYATYRIDSITNGVHAATWVAPPMQQLFDRHVAGWREDNASLRYALSIPRNDVWVAHGEAKQALLTRIEQAAGVRLRPEVFTIGFARRATQYKRTDLLFMDVQRLSALARQAGRIQLVFAGKAHPQDEPGKQLIQRVIAQGRGIPGIDFVYLENYDMALAQLMTAGCDIWLNTPMPPLEASGTSGMKAAMNGVPSLSVLDGWWIEGCINGITGWPIGPNHDALPTHDDPMEDATDVYAKLERQVLPKFYGNRDSYIDIMRHAIALNGSFFNTERMLDQYVTRAYFL